MSDYNDDYEDEKDNRFGSGYGSSSSSSYPSSSSHSTSSHSGSSAGNFGKTPDFNTMMIGKDGKFLGVELPQDMINTGRTLFPTILTWLSEHAYQLGMKHSGPTGAKVAGFGAALIQQELEIVENVRDSLDYLHKLNVAIRPLAKSGGMTLFSGDNEYIEDARGKAAGMFWRRLLDTGVGTIGAGWALQNIWKKQNQKHHEAQFQHEIENAKGDPNKLADIFEKEITIGTAKSGMSSEDIHMAKGKLLDKYRARYLEDFAVFEKANIKAVQGELEDLLKGLKKKDIKYNMNELRRRGFDTETLSEGLKRQWDREKNKYVEPEVEKAIKKFKDASKDQLEAIVKRELRKKFVLRKGVALDEDWVETMGDRTFERNAPPTIARQLDEKIEKFREAQEKAKREESEHGKGHNKESNAVIEGMKGFGAGVAAVFARNLLGGKALEKFAKPMALDRVMNLRKVLEPPQDAPEDWQPDAEVPPIPETKETPMGYVQYVHEIFQQHQKDRKWAEVGKQFFTHFEDAHWKDAAIMDLADDKLTPYEYAVKTIVQRIKTRRMDAIALLDLDGDKRGKKIVHSNGRSFGPLGASKDEAAVKKAILKLIDEKTVTLHAGQQQTEEQINEHLGNFVFSVDDLKKALESKDLDKHQRAFIFTLFSDVVGSSEKLCNKIGVSIERCQELRKESKESVNSMMDGAVIVLASVLKNEPKMLDKYPDFKLTKKQKKLIVTLADRAEEEHKNVADTTKTHEEAKSLETIVANAAMTLGRDKTYKDEAGKQGFWERLTTAAREKMENISKRHQKNASKGDDDSDGKNASDDMVDDENKADKKARGSSSSEMDSDEMPADNWRKRAKKDTNRKDASKDKDQDDPYEEEEKAYKKASGGPSAAKDKDELAESWGGREQGKGKRSIVPTDRFADRAGKDSPDGELAL